MALQRFVLVAVVAALVAVELAHPPSWALRLQPMANEWSNASTGDAKTSGFEFDMLEHAGT